MTDERPHIPNIIPPPPLSVEHEILARGVATLLDEIQMIRKAQEQINESLAAFAKAIEVLTK